MPLSSMQSTARQRAVIAALRHPHLIRLRQPVVMRTRHESVLHHGGDAGRLCILRSQLVPGLREHDPLPIDAPNEPKGNREVLVAEGA